MTLDEHIHKAEEDAKKAEFDTEWGIGNYFIDRTEALEYAKECRQLAEWLKDYKRLKEQEPCEDAISRQAVIDTIFTECSGTKLDIDFAKVLLLRRAIKSLPSVNPQPCEDAISRQDVLDCLTATGLKKYDYILNARNKIKNLPSVKSQEPKIGHWERISMDKYTTHAQYWYRCDRCGKDNLGNTDWCPSCGARMVEPQESEEE